MKSSKLAPIVIISLIATVISITLFLYLRREAKSKENISNCHKIELGMNVDRVIQIMGNPDDIIKQSAIHNNQSLETISYIYLTPEDSNQSIIILFDLASKQVVHVRCGE